MQLDNSLVAMLYAIWYHLFNLKNEKKTHGGVILLVKLQASHYPTKDSRIGPFVIGKTLKFYKFHRSFPLTLAIFSFLFILLCFYLFFFFGVLFYLLIDFIFRGVYMCGIYIIGIIQYW